MTYFPDLTPYRYFPGEHILSLPCVNIGWLDVSEPFAVGNVPNQFCETLLKFCLPEHLVRKTRGWHQCNLGNCPYPVPPESRGNQTIYFADAEIRVIGKTMIFAGPSLIYHYVAVHNYLPPNEFIQAVLTGPQPGSEEHLNVIDQVNRIEGEENRRLIEKARSK